MKNIIKKAQEKLVKFAVKIMLARANAKLALANQRGDQNVSSAVIILISIVVGALLLAGLYTLFDTVILPTISARITEMFDYAG